MEKVINFQLDLKEFVIKAFNELNRRKAKGRKMEICQANGIRDMGLKRFKKAKHLSS